MKTNPNPDLELMILRSMLTDKQSFMNVAAVNPPADIFSTVNNYAIYKEAMKIFQDTGQAPAANDVYENLVLSGKFPGMDEHFRSRLLNADFTNSAGYLVRLLTERAIEREIRKYMTNAPEKGLDLATSLVDFTNKTLQKFIGGCVRVTKNSEMAELVLNNIHDAMEGKFPNFIPTLIPELDGEVIGIPKGQLTVIAARPGMGKTDMMLQLMRNFMKQGQVPCVFSLEMNAQGLWVRNISEAANIDSRRIEKGELNTAEFSMLSDAAKKYTLDDYLIDDSPMETAEIIKAKINYWRMKHSVNVIMIDYMTLIHTSYKQERYDLEIGALVRDMTAFAKETGIPIIILSQLNRDSEKRINHRPHISDLRESGAIEQVANLVLMLYRPLEYGVDPFEGSKYRYFDQLGNEIKKEEFMEIVIAKARSGKTGVVPVRYTPATHRIESVKVVKK